MASFHFSPSAAAKAVVLALLTSPSAEAYDSLQLDGSLCLNRCQAGQWPPHGYCSEDLLRVCQCSDQWAGGAHDCSERVCPSGRAWFDMPTSATEAHTTAVPCSAKGKCNRQTGRCECLPGFEGEACQRMSCPAPGMVTCNGRGTCMTLAEAARRREQITALPPLAYGLSTNAAAWDANMIQGCVCEAGWTGYDCTQRDCPLGSDPLFRGSLEVQEISTHTSYVAEVQDVLLVGSGSLLDVDEVQTLTVYSGTPGTLAAGSIAMAFDSRAAVTGKCNLCITQGTASGSFSVDGIAANVATVASSLQTALRGFSNIGSTGVTVSGTVNEASGIYTFSITFSGSDVGGDVSLLTASTAVPGVTVSVVQATAGTEVTGNVVLSYDDSSRASHIAAIADSAYAADGVLMAARGSTTSVGIAAGALPSVIAAAVEGMLLDTGNGESSAGGIIVTRVGTGGPGITWRVTLAGAPRLRGDLPAMTVHGSSTLITGSSASVSTVTNGNFIAGTFHISLPFYFSELSEGAYQSDPTLEMAWNAAAATVQSSINALDAVFATGKVAVSRERLYENGGGSAAAWSGQYRWLVTFLNAKEDWPQMSTPGSTLLTGVGGQTVFLTVQTITQGASDASNPPEVNEVQILDCTCPLGDCTAAHFIRLSFNGETTAAIAHDASAATIAAALAALPSIPAVTVNQYGLLTGATTGSNPTGMCDYEGVSTAITFTHNPGPLPPLKVLSTSQYGSTATVAAGGEGYNLPATAVFAIRAGDGQLGAFGGRAMKGSRALLSCSGRGTCSTANGACSCFKDTTNSIFLYGASSNAGGEAGPAAATASDAWENCGALTGAAITSCPQVPGGTVCSGRGTCSGSPSWKCTCNAGYRGAACEQISCPTGRAWWALPSSTDPQTVHAAGAECSGRGTCSADGTCLCMDGFTGNACQYTICPGASNPSSSSCGRGQPCVTLKTLSEQHRYKEDGDWINPNDPSAFSYSTHWESSQMRGCACNTSLQYVGATAYNYQSMRGLDCSEMSCFTGDDPVEGFLQGQPDSSAFEVQSIRCWAEEGFLYFKLR